MLTAAFCQMASIPRQKQENADTADTFVCSLKDEGTSVDLLMLPEMVFSGYFFDSPDDIRPFLEAKEDSFTIKWCQKTARDMNCWVTAGFPLAHSDGKRYNAMCLVGRDGSLVHIYRKHFLYEDDENWAEEGPQFEAVDVPELGRVGFGICMDLNPWRFLTDWYLFEFANFHLKAKSNLILCAMGWLQCEDIKDSQIPYWVERLSPLDESNCTVLIANLVGTQSGRDFAGQSCIIQFKKGNVRVEDSGMDPGLYVIEFDCKP